MYKYEDLKSREYEYGPGKEFKNELQARKMAEYKMTAMLENLGRRLLVGEPYIDDNGYRLQVVIPTKYEA